MKQYKNKEGNVIRATEKAFNLLYKDKGYEIVNNKNEDTKKKTIKEGK
ncbi:hypothetical protein ACIQXQ_20150 [Peribacillus sp. NPDC097198]